MKNIAYLYARNDDYVTDIILLKKYEKGRFYAESH